MYIVVNVIKNSVYINHTGVFVASCVSSSSGDKCFSYHIALQNRTASIIVFIRNLVLNLEVSMRHSRFVYCVPLRRNTYV